MRWPSIQFRHISVYPPVSLSLSTGLYPSRAHSLGPSALQADKVCEKLASWQTPGLLAHQSVPGPSSATACIALGGHGSSQTPILAGLGLPLANECLGWETEC